MLYRHFVPTAERLLAQKQAALICTKLTFGQGWKRYIGVSLSDELPYLSYSSGKYTGVFMFSFHIHVNAEHWPLAGFDALRPMYLKTQVLIAVITF